MLTMSAAYDDVPLPEPHEEDLLLAVAPGAYRCTVVQLQDPVPYDVVRSDPDFVLVLARADGRESPWADFPWTEGSLA
jgi:hypothetical protein